MLALNQSDYEMVTDLIAKLRLEGNTFYYHKGRLVELDLMMEQKICKGKIRETRIAITEKAQMCFEAFQGSEISDR